MKAILYTRPDGHAEEIEITNVSEEDAAWFKENDNVEVSMEDIGSTFAVYGTTGDVDEEGEPIEMVVLSNGRTCTETLYSLRGAIEEYWKWN